MKTTRDSDLSFASSPALALARFVGCAQDSILRWILPEEKLGHLKRCMPSSHHGFDREGHPIHFEQTGHFRWEILKHCSAEELVKIHILAQEYQARVLFPRAR